FSVILVVVDRFTKEAYFGALHSSYSAHKVASLFIDTVTAYHPETDGQTEVLNRVLEQYLRAFVHDKPSHWFSFLSLAEWSYNTAVHSATGVSPFEATFGKPPPSLPSYLAGDSSIEPVDSILTFRTHLHTVLQRRLAKAQAAMKKHTDSHRRDIQFNIRDWVFVRLRPYRQTSLQPHYTKLSKRFYDPF
ncbi:Retrotransposable element Tf2 155 kDa protein type 2, partial [Glycine soja]